MSDPEIEAVQRLYEAYSRGDVEAVLAELADDVDWSAEAASTSVPWFGCHRGKDDVARFFKRSGRTSRSPSSRRCPSRPTTPTSSLRSGGPTR